MTPISAFSSAAPGRSAAQPADPRLWKAAQDFQQVFLAQFVQTMRTTGLDAELVEECAGRETFDQMYSDALGRSLAEGDGMGLQDKLYREMGGRFRPADAATNLRSDPRRNSIPVE